ncbi:transmembrane protein, putative [Medicago truncatula]|uniref:Transmembrane protein, putative n=1 Tax=Medicago truncatula TaxID=3880 RepID=G7KMP9_MEDTR|nr:transmembrane protein, putative [Medicago truncatula]
MGYEKQDDEEEWDCPEMQRDACFLHFIRFVFVVKTLLAVKYDIWYIHMKGMSYNTYIGQYLPLFLIGDP